MQPNYRLDGSTRYIVLQLINKCIDLNLDNISFDYTEDKLSFYLTKQDNVWELTVKQSSCETADVWIVDDDAIFYQGTGGDGSSGLLNFDKQK